MPQFAYDPCVVEKKYRANNMAGPVKFLTRTGPTYPNEEEWPPGWKNDANVAALWSQVSEALIGQRVTEHVVGFAKSAGLKVFLPTLHSTILSGDLMQGDLKDATFDGARADMFHRIEDDMEMQDILTEFPGIEATFNYIVFDGGNVTLNCEEIPEPVAECRATVDKVFRRFGVPPKSMENIFHVTIARLQHIPPDIGLGEMARFVTELHDLALDVMKQPITLRTERLWFGRDIQTKLRAGL